MIIGTPPEHLFGRFFCWCVLVVLCFEFFVRCFEPALLPSDKLEAYCIIPLGLDCREAMLMFK